MIELAYKFRVATGTSRRPTPLKYEHLRKYIDKAERFISLSSIEQVTNVNQQLEQTANLFVSNVISRVIAQLIGQTDKGFVTIKGTDDGALKVYIDDFDPSASLSLELSAGTNLIGKVQIEGTSQTPLRAAINIATGVTHDIIAAVSGKKHKITFIMFTVAGDVSVTLRDETGAISGVMDFGGTDEPRGMVANHAQIPMVCTVGEKFQITLSSAVQVSGYCLYYDEA